ncbi:MAG: hypothetical protein GY816_12055 [Cytophagales bacterium]|nr:hypothetical protein [Cytophagales bacterium]
MTSRLKRHIDLLRVLCNAKPKLRKAILNEVDNDTIRCLCDCSHNVLNGNIALSPKQKKQLTKYRKKLRQLTDIKEPLAFKRKLLVQQGGALPVALLAPIIAIASALLSKI